MERAWAQVETDLFQGLPAEDQQDLAGVLMCRAQSLLQSYRTRLNEAKERQHHNKAQTQAAIQSLLEKRALLVDVLKRLDGGEEERAPEEEESYPPSEEGGAGGGGLSLKARLSALENEEQYLKRLKRGVEAVESAEKSLGAGQFSKIFDCLVSLAEARDSDFAEMDRWVRSQGDDLVKRTRSALRQRLDDAMAEVRWPGGTELSQEAVRMVEYLVKLQALAPKVGAAEHGPAVMSLWAGEELSRPVLERFAFHFEGMRATNASNRPEWFFHYLLKAVRAAAPDLEGELSMVVEPLLTSSSGGSNGGSRSPPREQSPGRAVAAFFTREVIIAVRRKIRSLLESAWDHDVALCHLIEESLAFDQALDEMPGVRYYSSTRAFPQARWPRVTEVFWQSPERLDRWVEVDSQVVKAKLDMAFKGDAAWSALGVDTKYAMTPAAQAFAGLFTYLTQRYRPVTEGQVQLALVNRVQKPLVIHFLYALYSAAKACAIHQAVFDPLYIEIFERYFLMASSTRYGLEVLEDALNDVAFLRLEALLEKNKSSGPSTANQDTKGPQMVVASALMSGQEVVKEALTTFSSTTDNLTKAVEESNVIIGPTRVLSAALGSINKVVKKRTGGSGSKNSSPAKASTITEEGEGRGNQPSPGRKGEDNKGDSATVHAVDSIMGDLLFVEPTQSSSTSVSFFSSEAHHLHNFANAMLDDALDAIKAGFYSKAQPYLSGLGTWVSKAGPVVLRRVHPDLVEALSFLDQIVSTGHASLDQESFLKLWQGMNVMACEALLNHIKRCRQVSELGGQLLGRDAHALAEVFKVGPHKPDNYFRSLFETVRLLGAPHKSLGSLREFLQDMLNDSTLDITDDDGSCPVASHVRAALEIQGVFTLTPMEVSAVLHQRLTPGRSPKSALSGINGTSGEA